MQKHGEVGEIDLEADDNGSLICSSAEGRESSSEEKRGQTRKKRRTVSERFFYAVARESGAHLLRSFGVARAR